MNYLENLTVLRAAVEAEPEQMLRLDKFVYDTPCGTLHCTAGLAATLPHFNALGLRLRLTGDTQAPRIGEMGVRSSLNQIFGVYPDKGDDDSGTLPWDAMRVIFDSYACGQWDDDLLDGSDLTHKELALARLDQAIAYHELIAQGPAALRAAGYGRVAAELEKA